MTINIYGSKENQEFEKLNIEIGAIGEGNFEHLIIVPEDENELGEAVGQLNELRKKARNTSLTIITNENFKGNTCIEPLKDNINILFNDYLVKNHKDIIDVDASKVEQFFQEFCEERIQHVNYDSNPNFEKSKDVCFDYNLAEKRQNNELLDAANRFIAFEYCDEKGKMKDKYQELGLEKIHSSFGVKVEGDVITEARNAVCGGVYNKVEFQKEKEKSIYNGVDKFKASIDGDGYLVIQSVAGGTIKDEHFQEGVKTNFKFEGRGGTEVTQDNLRKLFTNGSHGKDSGLSLLGAIEQSFQALKTIEKDNNGKLINPKSSEEFNAIFPEYGATLRVQPTLAFSEAGAEAPPLPPPAAVPPAPAPGGAGSATVPAAEEAEAAPKVKVAAPAPEAAAPTGAPAVGAPPTDTVSEAAAPPAATVPETPGYLGLIRRAAVVAAATAKAAAPEETPAPEELAEGARQTVSTTPMLEERLKRASEPEAGAPGSEEATAPAAPPPPPAGTPSTSLEGPAVAEEVLLTTARQATL